MMMNQYYTSQQYNSQYYTPDGQYEDYREQSPPQYDEPEAVASDNAAQQWGQELLKQNSR
jgi:hypothetical protein